MEKHILITGASSGIGKACALYLDQKGYSVFAGVRKESDGFALQNAASKKLIPVILEITSSQSIEKAQQTVSNLLKDAGLTALVNNAGIACGGPVEYTDIEALRLTLEVNVVGTVAVTKAFLPMLHKGYPGSRIINMSSISGRVALPFLGPYAASKFALEALTDSLRLELKPHGIAVSLLEPGNVSTPVWEKMARAYEKMVKTLPEQAFSRYGRQISYLGKGLVKKGISPDQVAVVVEEIIQAAKPKARYLVGKDARRLAIIGALPTWLRDRLILKKMTGKK